MKKKLESPVGENEELLTRAIMEFYVKHCGYRMSQTEFIGIICALSQQAMHDF